MLAELAELQPHHFDSGEVRRSRVRRREIRRLLRRAGCAVAVAPEDELPGCLRAIGVVPSTSEAGAAIELAAALAEAGGARVDVLRVADAVPPWLAILSASSPWIPPYVDARTASALAADHGRRALPPDVFLRCATGCPKAAVVAFSRSVDLLVMDAGRAQLVEAALRAAGCPLVLVPADLRVHAQRSLAFA